MQRTITSALAVGLLAWPILGAAATPLTAPLQLSSSTDNARQVDLTSAPSGFVAGWISSADGAGLRRLDDNGTPLIAAMPVAGTVSGDDNVRVAADAASNYIVVWTELTGTFSNRVQHIYGRRFDASDSPLGDRFEISSVKASDTSLSGEIDGLLTLQGTRVTASVAMNAGGEFIVTWVDPIDLRVGDPLIMPTLRPYINVVYARRYDANGTALNDGVVVAAELPDLHFFLGFGPDLDPYSISLESDVAIDDAGNAFVVWKNSGLDNATGTIYLRAISADGRPSGLKRQVSPLSQNVTEHPRVALDGSGNPTVAWVSASGICAQRFDAAGRKLGSMFRVDETVESTNNPDLSAHPDGRLTVVWRQGGNPHGVIYAREFAADATPLAAPFQVSTTDPNVHADHPKIASTADGRFMVAWDTVTNPSPYTRAILARVYAAP